MTGYAAMARVERGSVRALAWEGAAAIDALVVDDRPDGSTLEPDDGITLAEELERLRDQLRMVTFYLTDPDSWR